ncbi:MAG: aromatic aminobenezylarsenical efflux permease ArsG family transporter [Bryobacteraceae bacterium]|jgi:sulfite exporter TauE/SafE
MDGVLAGAASAMWLGILTSISPCPLATNVAAMSFIGKSLSSPRRVLLTGLLYTLGRTIAYAALAALLIASVFAIPDVSFFLEMHMNKLLGPLLIVVGLLLLDLVPLGFPGSCVIDSIERRFRRSGLWGAGALGMLFALSFCPVSAALFFGSLIPLAVKQGSVIGLPSIYGVGTGLPVFGFAVLIALGAQWVSKAFKRVAQFEKWARRITAAVFIVVGVRYCLNYIFEVQI